MERSIVTTEDGSPSIYVKAIDECYHSTHGARQESEHIFIQTALRQHASKRLSILEVGFGTGLNALLTCIEAPLRELDVHYTGIELYPISSQEVEQLVAFSHPHEDVFLRLHQVTSSGFTPITSHFQLKKLEVDFTQIEIEENSVDIIYFDAFSPEKQPEMWSQERFDMLYKACRPGGILTTYCAKGVVRRAMQHAGFVVERLPGPPGKREILRARKLDI
ncbi:MAG: tRNA (5-methylaminomethyl-2-thiouridine)(34)-methyltransferase MnmD [Paludibacteraceae bacterium]|nr:tRNA (5-methylaminomethyl-2-thiouridine)(34)-methyltransferase MnmD [Paludibacteraceae bacterium]